MRSLSAAIGGTDFKIYVQHCRVHFDTSSHVIEDIDRFYEELLELRSFPNVLVGF